MKSPRFAQTMIVLSIGQVLSLALMQVTYAGDTAVELAMSETASDAGASADVATSSESAVEQILIQAQRSSNGLARAAQKEAPNLINLMTAEDIKKLPDAWGGPGAGFNYTYVNSSFQIRPGETALLPSTSKNSANVPLFYERDGINVRLGGYYVSTDLWAVGGSNDTDVYNSGRFTMDLGSSYTISPNWSLYGNIKNLTNIPLAFYEGYSNRVIQRQYYDATVQAGVNFNF